MGFNESSKISTGLNEVCVCILVISGLHLERVLQSVLHKGHEALQDLLHTRPDLPGIQQEAFRGVHSTWAKLKGDAVRTEGLIRKGIKVIGGTAGGGVELGGAFGMV